MIQKLSVKNFKSLKNAAIDCARVNVFIGQPNSGKSNLLEALGMLSYSHYYSSTMLADFVRMERSANLFYDGDLDEPLEIQADSIKLILEFQNGRFKGKCTVDSNGQIDWAGDHRKLQVSDASGRSDFVAPFKSYRFKPFTEFDQIDPSFLRPPYGTNLVSLLLSSRDLRSAANDLLAPFGLRLGIRPEENKIEALKAIEDVIISYPYTLLSDTLQRVIFYMCAIERNKDSVLIFEEPEAHAFPYYTKYLAERIALDERRNQYFVSTHNPYFLMPLIEKTRIEDLGIFLTYYKDYQTRLKRLNQNELQDLTELDIFSNLDSFLDEA